MKPLARTFIHPLAFVFVLNGAVGCAADRFAASSESADQLIAQWSQTAALIADAYADDLQLQSQLVDHAFTMRQIIIRRSILIDLDEFISPSGVFDPDLLDSQLREPSANNILISEIRSGRMTVAQAKQLLSDHAQTARMSAEMRSSIESRLTSRFTAMRMIEKERTDIANTLAERRESVSRLASEANRSAAALRTAFSRAPSGSYPSRYVDMRELLTSATQLVGDHEIREVLQQTINDLYRENPK